jgi:rfaE bifunctional protein nucleotidyltransferase chain/domain
VKPLLVVGDALLDRDVSGSVRRICPDAPVPVLEEELVCARPGGAALAAALAAADGREVTLLTALGRDPAAQQLERLLGAAGVEVIDLGLDGRTPEKVRLRSAGQSLLRVDRGGQPGGIGELSAAGRAAIGWAEAILIADYGRGLTSQEAVRTALAGAAAEKQLIWDPHPRGAAPVAGVELLTPNEQEAPLFAGAPVRHVCVTQGSAGAVLHERNMAPQRVPAPRIGAGDPCGAGDRFSSALAGALADGHRLLDAVRQGVARASAFVCAGGAAAWLSQRRDGAPLAAEPSWASEAEPGGGDPADPARLAAAVRSRGGTVVATGGCFDLLHTGHVRMLAAARRLGDCLIVCLNSDASVRRLKGPARPVVAEVDRAAVLAALEWVDAVTIFEQDTPIEAIERLRPHVWAKGGDYSPEELPERAALERWGGRVVTLPYIEGHSTTRLLKEVAFRVAS